MGQVCPLGTLQRFFGALGNRLFIALRDSSSTTASPVIEIRSARLLYRLDRRAARLVMSPMTQGQRMAHITSPSVQRIRSRFVILIIASQDLLYMSVSSVVYLCRWALSLDVFKIEFIGSAKCNVCIVCKSCDKICLMGISVSTTTKVTQLSVFPGDECVKRVPCSRSA